MAVYGAGASWLAGVQHVITMHGNRYYAGRWRRRLAMRAAVAGSGRTVAVSNSLAAHMSGDLGIARARIVTIPNGVRHAAPERLTLREELRLAPSDRLLVAVGNLYPVKGHQHLIDAMALLSVRHPTLHVAIAGRGDLAEPLISRARDLGIADRVHLLGLRRDIPSVLAAAEMFVLPSLSEALPLALLEAMFAGHPIVASDVGDVRAVLASGDAGLLVEPGDPQALAAAIDRLLTDPALARAIGERAHQRASSQYDISQMLARYGAIYEDVLMRPPSRCIHLMARTARH
jgi:glycosyltransferase involved in cell wall biosynthesis